MGRRLELSLSLTTGLIAPWIASSAVYFMSLERWSAALGASVLATALSAISLEGLIHAAIHQTHDPLRANQSMTHSTVQSSSSSEHESSDDETQ